MTGPGAKDGMIFAVVVLVFELIFHGMRQVCLELAADPGSTQAFQAGLEDSLERGTPLPRIWFG